MHRVARIIVIVLMSTAVAVCASGDKKNSGNGNGNGNGHKQGKNGKVRQARSGDGDYSVRLVGAYKGTGTAEVSEDTISFDASITTADGVKGQLSARGLPIDGPYFAGNGTAMGRPIFVRGRLDAAKSSRLVANYRDPETHLAGRIVGTLPTD